MVVRSILSRMFGLRRADRLAIHSAFLIILVFSGFCLSLWYYSALLPEQELNQRIQPLIDFGLCKEDFGSTNSFTTSQDGMVLDYLVEIAEPGITTAHVTLNIKNVDIDMLRIIQEYEAVLNFSAYDAKGNVIEAKPIGAEPVCQWDVKTKHETEIVLEYDINVRRTKNAGYYISYVGQNFGVLDGRYLFAYPRWVEPASIKISFELTNGWRCVTPWIEGEGCYWPNSIRHMQWSAIGIGDFKAFKKFIKNVEVDVAIFGDESQIRLSGPPGAPANVTQGLFEIFDHHISLFGGLPYEKYLIIMTPLTIDGKGIVTSSAQDNSYAVCYTSGGWGWSGNAHEMFHAWNAHALNLTPPTEYGFHWFSEGFTTYYQERTLVDLGWQTEDDFFNLFQRYYDGFNEEFLGTEYDVPLSESGDLMARNWEEPYVFVTYYKGALLAFLLDQKIREISEGRLCLDDFMRYLYEEQSEDILEALNTLTQHDFTNFFEKYVYSTEKLPLEAYFLFYSGESSFQGGNYQEAKASFTNALELFMEEGNQWMTDRCEARIEEIERVEEEHRLEYQQKSYTIIEAGLGAMVIIVSVAFIWFRKKHTSPLQKE